jgi:hypothetical protein
LRNVALATESVAYGAEEGRVGESDGQELQEEGRRASNRSRMTGRRVTAAAALAVALGSATAFAGVTGPTALPTSEATPTKVTVPVRTSSYGVYDAKGHKSGTARWRISPAGGNCCETYVSSTRSGRVVESGGTYPWYTDDRGKHWYEVKFDVPDQNDNGQAIAGGEGATVVGPDGSVYGVTWDAYSGDHLQSYSYTPQSKAWAVSEVVMKSPFYDRPWLTYARGPVSLSSGRTMQLLDVTGGGITKDIDTFSPDGLDYSDPSFFYGDEQRLGTGRFAVKVVRNQDADWWQPHPGTGTLALNAGGVLRFHNNEDITGSRGCPVAHLGADAQWYCVKTKGTFQGVVRQDSRGYLVEAYPTPGNASLVLALSRDGGVHWRRTTLSPPKSTGAARLETKDLFDVVANGVLGQAAVSARFDDAKGNGHDMVFRVDTRGAAPRLRATYLVGKGDINTANDVTGSTGYRYDYESVALLPDGKLVVSFDDSSCLQPSLRDPTHRAPQVAILL